MAAATLYFDESGTDAQEGEARQVRACVHIPTSKAGAVSSDLNRLRERIHRAGLPRPEDRHPLELHAYDMRQGTNVWGLLPKAVRSTFLREVGGVIRRHGLQVSAIAVPADDILKLSEYFDSSVSQLIDTDPRLADEISRFTEAGRPDFRCPQLRRVMTEAMLFGIATDLFRERRSRVAKKMNVVMDRQYVSSLELWQTIFSFISAHGLDAVTDMVPVIRERRGHTWILADDLIDRDSCTSNGIQLVDWLAYMTRRQLEKGDSNMSVLTRGGALLGGHEVRRQPLADGPEIRVTSYFSSNVPAVKVQRRWGRPRSAKYVRKDGTHRLN